MPKKKTLKEESGSYYTTPAESIDGTPKYSLFLHRRSRPVCSNISSGGGSLAEETSDFSHLFPALLVFLLSRMPVR